MIYDGPTNDGMSPTNLLTVRLRHTGCLRRTSDAVRLLFYAHTPADTGNAYCFVKHRDTVGLDKKVPAAPYLNPEVLGSCLV